MLERQKSVQMGEGLEAESMGFSDVPDVSS